MTLKIFNSLNHKIEEFKPIKTKKVGMYTCGPTVYNYAHIGNLRTYIFEDILKRTLLVNGYQVKHVMNITDVGHLTDDADTGEDKMEKGARREGKSAWEIAKFYINAFENDLSELKILPPNIWCRATEHIQEQINLIRKLEKKGFTYQTSDGVYFDTSKFPEYGKMANLKNRTLRTGTRVELGEKKNPTDFALWKFSPKNEKRQMEWKSPWGIGFPGWHIECSAMSVKYLGQPFDIHCGGIDHIPVHHINEIAQNEAANDKKLANYWLHGEFLIIGKEKMAKSGENFITIATIKEKNINPVAYRYFVLQAHYRKQLNFTWEALQAAEKGWERLRQSVMNLNNEREKETDATKKYFIKFVDCLNNDLNTAEALALTWKILDDKKITAGEKILLIKKIDKVLDLDLFRITPTEPLPPEILDIVNERNQARAEKNWQLSDKLRKILEQKGYEIKDSKEGTKISRS